MFFKERVFKNVDRLPKKNLWQSPFLLNFLINLLASNFIKKETLVQVFTRLRNRWFSENIEKQGLSTKNCNFNQNFIARFLSDLKDRVTRWKLLVTSWKKTASCVLHFTKLKTKISSFWLRIAHWKLGVDQ